jgi:glutamate/tyrosine decarboxylase-like PLP-dependent enzyme
MARDVDGPDGSDGRSERARAILDAAQRAATYGDGVRDRDVVPTDEAVAALAGFGERVPEGPMPAADVLATLDRLGSPATMAVNGGRYFGYVTGGTDPAAQAAAILAGAWDQNAALPVMSPVAAHLDALAAAWTCDLLGLAPTAVAAFCGGATVANLTGILAGRDALLARQGWDVDRRGLAGAPALRVVTGAEAHSSVFKALRMAGIGRDAVTTVPTDHCGRLVAAEFPAVDDHTLVVLQAGNVNTGHSDPFAEVVGRARRAGAWVHVDGAFGLWAAVAPARRHLVAGVEGADSWATDAHKWLNVAYDSGIAVCARGEDLARAFATEAAYLASGAGRAPMHLSVQMSQRARAVEAWAVYASRGRQGLAEVVEAGCRHAARLAERLAAGGAEVLAPVVLNQALVSFGDDATTDATIAALQRAGTLWAGATTWHGRRALRLSVSDESTTDADVERAADAILACRAAVA